MHQGKGKSGNAWLLDIHWRAPVAWSNTSIRCATPTELQCVSAGGCPSWSLLETLRRHFCTPLDRKSAVNAVQGKMVSSSNEEQVLKCISAVCVKVLHVYLGCHPFAAS